MVMGTGKSISNFNTGGGGGGTPPAGTSISGGKAITKTLTAVGGEPTVITQAHGLAAKPKSVQVCASTGEVLNVPVTMDNTNIYITVSETYTNAIINIIQF